MLRTAVVGERKTEDIGVHYYNGSGAGAVADYVGVEAVDGFFLAEGLASMDAALLCVSTYVQVRERFGRLYLDALVA